VSFGGSKLVCNLWFSADDDLRALRAVLNHIPLTGVGHRQVKTYDLPLMRYDPGEPLPLAPSKWSRAGRSKQSSVSYVINTPPFALGPMDLVPVSLKLNPSDPATSVHSIALVVERRLEFNNPPFGSDDTSLSSTTNLVTHSNPPSPSSKTSAFLVTSSEATDVPRDENGIYVRTLTLQVPPQKSTRYDVFSGVCPLVLTLSTVIGLSVRRCARPLSPSDSSSGLR
jgi:hypothetical protein